MTASQTGTDRASMPDDQSEEPPSPDLRSMLTLHVQRQQKVPVISPSRYFACAAASIADAAAR
ncbi:hypothetical protein, partial [Phyllobacterium sp. P5_D12]